MRKQFKMLLLVATVLALFVMTMIVSSASEEAPYVALNGETVVSEHGSFSAAYEVVKAGNANTIRLDADVVLSACIELDADVIIDGGNHTMTFDNTVRNCWMFTFVAENLNVTVKNVTIKHSLPAVDIARSSGLFLLLNGTTLNVKNVISDNHGGDLIIAEAVNSGITLTVEDSVLKTNYVRQAFMFSLAKDSDGNISHERNTLTFKNTTMSGKNSLSSKRGMLYSIGTDVFIDSCNVETPGYFLHMDAGSYANTFTITGDTNINAGWLGYTKGNNNIWTIGTQDDGPQPNIHVQEQLDNWNNAVAGTITIYGGTFTSEKYFFRLSKGAHNINIQGGTFILDKGYPLISYVNAITANINITKGEFHLSNNSTMVKLKSNSQKSGIKLPTAETAVPGNIKVYLGDGAAEVADTQKFFKADEWIAAGTHFYITAWELDTSKLYEFKQDFTGNFDELKKKISEVVFADPISVYEALRSGDDAQIFFSADDEAAGKKKNLFIEVGVLPPFVIKNSDVTVTINGGSYNALDKLAILEGGNLVFTGCEINAATTLVTLMNGKLTIQDARITATGSDPLIVVNSGASVEIKGASTSVSVEGSMVNITHADCGTVTVNEGTYISSKGAALFTASVDGIAGKISIVKATFRLAGASTLSGGKLTNSSYTLPTTAAPGDITFYLDAGSADSTELQEFLSADKWYAAKTRYYVIGWGAGEASLYEMTENFSGTLEDYKAMLREYILTAPQNFYEKLRSESAQQVFFTSGDNKNLFVEYTTIPEMLPFVIKDPSVTVTLTNWNYTTNGMFARVEAGKLILNNCTIEYSINSGALVFVNGANATVEVVGGVLTGSAPCIFDVTTGKLNITGGIFVNTKSNIVNLNGAGEVTLSPATPETILRFYAGNSIIEATNAANSTVTINGGEYTANYVEDKNAPTAFVSMFLIGGNGAKLIIHGGSFNNDGGAYIFDFSAAGAEISIDGGTFNGGRGWLLADLAGTFTVNANADPTKNPVFTDVNGAAEAAYIVLSQANAKVTLNAGTFTAGVVAYGIFDVTNGTLTVTGGTYTGSLFYVATTGKTVITGGTFTASGKDAVLFKFSGTVPTANFKINAATTFTVTDNAYIFDTSMNAATVSTLLTNANIVVTGYSKVGLAFSGTTNIAFATDADARDFLKAYVAKGTLTFNPDTTVPTFKISGKVNIVVSGGNWNYGSDYLFNLASGSGSSVIITGGTFDSYGGGLLYLAGATSTVVIGNTTDAGLAPKFNVTDGLGILYNAGAGSTVTIENGTFTVNDFKDCNVFTFNANTKVLVNNGSFTINKGASVDKDGKVENNSVLFYALNGTTNITINNGSFKAARIAYYTKAGTLDIYDGDFSSNAFSMHNSYMFHMTKAGTTFNIYGGTFTGNNYTTYILYLKSSGTITANIYGGSFRKGLTWLCSKGPNKVTFDKLVDEETGQDLTTGPEFNTLNDGVGANMSGGTPADYTPKGILFEDGYDAVVDFKVGKFALGASETVSLFMLQQGAFTFYDGVEARAPYIMFAFGGAADQNEDKTVEGCILGTLTIKGGTYTGIYVADIFSFTAAAQTAETPLVEKIVIEGGTFRATDSATIFNIASLDNQASLLITGGTFSSEQVRLAFFTKASTMNFTIEGGTFSTEASRMFYFDENVEPLVIKGGTFVLDNKSGNKADDGIIYAVGKKATKVSVQGGVFVDNRKGNNQTFIKMNPLAVVEFAGPFKIYVAEQKTNFYYDSDDNAKSVPFAQTKETYNDEEYYVCFAYYNQYAPVVYDAPALRPVMGAEGLTFTSSVSAETAAHLATLGTVSYGTLIFPTKYLVDGWQQGTDFLAELKAYAQENGKSESTVYTMVNAVNGVVYAEDGSFTIRASIINFKEQNYTLDLTGIAYAKVTAEDGTETYYYASHMSAGVTNNMRSAAKAALYDLNATAIDDGLHVYCYASIMKNNSFSRYSAPFQESLKKYMPEGERMPQW